MATRIAEVAPERTLDTSTVLSHLDLTTSEQHCITLQRG